jgi:hypothetical protein
MGQLASFEVPGAIRFAVILISDSHSRRAALREENGPCVPVSYTGTQIKKHQAQQWVFVALGTARLLFGTLIRRFGTAWG